MPGLFPGRPDLAQVFAAASVCQPSRDDLLLLAGVQFRNAADAIAAGDAHAARNFGLDALGYIERARVAGG